MMNRFLVKRSPYHLLFPFLRPFLGQAIIATSLMLLGAILKLPAPLLTRYLFDRIIPTGNTIQLFYFTFILAILLIAANTISILQTKFVLSCRYGIENTIRSHVLERLLGASQVALKSEPSGYMVSRVDDDVAQIQRLFLDPLLQLLLQGLTLIVGIILAFQLNSGLALISIITLPLFIMIYTSFSKKLENLMSVRQETVARFRGDLQEVISQSSVVQAFSLQDRFTSRCNKRCKSALDAARHFEFVQALATSMTALIAAILPLFVLWYGSFQIILGRFTIGGFIAFTSCIAYLYNPVRIIIGLRLDIQGTLAAAQRVLEVIEMPQANHDFGDRSLSRIDNISATQLIYTYPGRPGIGIKDTTFSLNHNESLAVVGETGSGKSTLARLILGFDLPTSGGLTINGHGIQEYCLSSIRNEIGYVPQEPALFQGSILENIVAFEPNYNKTWFNELINLCVLRDVIDRFPEGFHTLVQEAGAGLSGGEKQRVAIARALYREPSLLLFDEGTSAMDPATESRILNSVLNLSWRPALLFITHRHRLLPLFDKVLQMPSVKMDSEQANESALKNPPSEIRGICEAAWDQPEVRGRRPGR